MTGKHFRECQTALLDKIDIMWERGALPLHWKMQLLFPVFYYANLTDQLMCGITSKVLDLMKKMLLYRLQHYIKANNVLHAYQIGFRPHASAQDALILRDHIPSIRTAQKSTVMGIDIKNAFK